MTRRAATSRWSRSVRSPSHSTVYRGQWDKCEHVTELEELKSGRFNSAFLGVFLDMRLTFMPSSFRFYFKYFMQFHFPLQSTHIGTHTRFRVCPHFSLFPAASNNDREETDFKKKVFSFPLLHPAAFSPPFPFFQKLHDNQKILPRVHCRVGMEEGRRVQCVWLSLQFSFKCLC